MPLSSIRLPTNTCRPLRVVRKSWVSIVSPSLCTDDVQSKSRIGLTTFPTPALPGFLHLDWSFEPQRYYVVIRLPECHLPPSFIQLVGHTRSIMIGSHGTIKNNRASLVACLTATKERLLVEFSRYYVARMGRRLRDSSHNLPMTRCEVLPSGMTRPWAVSNRNNISELHPFIAAGLPTVNSSSQPFCVRFKIRPQAISGHNTHPATLDTRRVANAYLGGSLTR